METIDNLSLDSSRNYAISEKHSAYILDGAQISNATTSESLSPAFNPELESFLGTKNPNSIAAFNPPNGYNAGIRSLFTYVAAPLIGPNEKIDTCISHITMGYEQYRKKRSKRKKAYSWEEKSEIENEKKESKLLLALLKVLQFINTLLELINGRRMQFTKG